MGRLFIYGNVFLIFLWIIITTLLSFIPYPEFLEGVINAFSLQNHQEEVAKIFTSYVYLRLKGAILFTLFLHGTAFIFILKKPLLRLQIKSGLKAVLEYPRWLWMNFVRLGVKEKIAFAIFIAAIIIHRLVLSYKTGIIYDEAWTYLAFTSKNPLVAACFYPSSNNHILFSHLTQLTKLLPFDILTNLRLAALFPNLLAITTLFFCLRKYVSVASAWLAIIFFAFSFPIEYYGFVARGYSLIVLFFTIGFFSLIQILQNPSDSKPWFRLMFSSALGFYAIPVYLYPLITLFGFAALYFLFSKNMKALGTAVLFGFTTLVIISLLYLPVFTISGFQSVMGNKYVLSIPFAEWRVGIYTHAVHTLQFFTQSQNLPVIGILIIAILIKLLFNSNIRNAPGIYICLWCFLLAPILILIHRIIPVERTWIYLTVPIAFLLSLLFNTIKWEMLPPIAGLCLLYLFSSQVMLQYQMDWYDKVCEEDYAQGKYFSDYFHDKEVSIVTDSRMLTYLKFNRQLKNESWNIFSDFDQTPLTNIYVIQYLKDETPDSVPEGYSHVDFYHGYRLLKY